MDSPTEFEDEMLALNPEYDLIFRKYNELSLTESPTHYEPRKRHAPNKLKIITKMNEIIGQKSIGELPTNSDWDEHDTVEKETIALMRKFGLEQSIDRTPDESRTISTVPTSEDVVIMRNGRKKMSIFMSDSFFELKPRVQPVFCTDDEPTHDDSAASTSDATEETSLSTSLSSGMSSESARPSKVEYMNVSSAKSSDSSDLSWRRNRSPASGSSNKMVGNSSRSATNWRSGSANAEETAKRMEETAPQANSNRVASNSSRSVPNWRSGSEETAKREGETAPHANLNKVSCNSSRDSTNAEETAPQANSLGIDFKVEENSVQTKVEPTSVTKIKPQAISSCGSPLYKPKDLFLKKRAMMLRQVFCANESQRKMN